MLLTNASGMRRRCGRKVKSDLPFDSRNQDVARDGLRSDFGISWFAVLISVKDR